MKPKILILYASGINRDHEAAWACELAGGQPDIVHINQLRDPSSGYSLTDYHMLVVAGGFSYGDALGAGRRLALDLTLDLRDKLEHFIEQRKPILGICNGFQALVKANLLPSVSRQPVPVDPSTLHAANSATLTHNARGKFECRWVTLLSNPASPCIFTRDLTEPIYCPVAHGEGRFVAKATVPDSQVALRYHSNCYPANPNGTADGIAGICNQTGTILGLMPHPEDHIMPWQHPRWTRDEAGCTGLPLFEAGIRYAAQVA